MQLEHRGSEDDYKYSDPLGTVHMIDAVAVEENTTLASLGSFVYTIR